jgi:hypothetical protein
VIIQVSKLIEELMFSIFYFIFFMLSSHVEQPVQHYSIPDELVDTFVEIGDAGIWGDSE